MRAITITFIATLMLVALFFAAPAFAQDTPATEQPLYDGRNTMGVADAAQTPGESCRASCNRDYEVCNDEGQASDSSLNGRPSAGFSKNHCNASLSSCMQSCRAL